MENRSLAKALSLIETLAASQRPLTAVQLNQTLKITRPTVYRILKTLVQRGFVTREEGGAAYRLSFKLLDLGHQVLERTDLLEAARPVLQKLSGSCRETAHLAVPEDGRMVYLDKLEGSGPFCMQSRLGRSVPMHCTALGKAVLAFLPLARTRAILVRHGMARFTPRTIVTASAMERELARIRRQGYAIDDVEFEDGVRCVGAPIFDHGGSPIAAISVSAPASRMPLARAHETGGLVRDAVVGISQAMGWGSGASRHPGILVSLHSKKPVERSMSFGRPLPTRRRPEKAPHPVKGGEMIGRG